MKRQTTIHALLLILAIVTAMVTDMHAVATKTFSDGWTPIYYDIRGNVTSLREITDFGTLRVTDNTYTFTNQPLTTKMTESGGVTMLTENTYDTNSGLLVATDVTVNGVKQRVSKVTYDDLGRIASVVRGNGANSGGTVSYAYNLHGQTIAINGPGFTQKLHYTDGPGKPLYNGSISSMLWTMGSDATQRGYKYTYNGYNWLTLAEYGEGSTLSSHKDRYTERFSEFMLNGGIRRLQRHGLKTDGNYGKIDNLHISYNGNRITTVLEDADPVTQSGSMDYPGAKREMEFGYNDWGALVSDESRGIKAIEYDSFGNPVNIKFSGRDYTKNVYSATGVKLKTEHFTDPLVVGPPAVGEIHQSDPVPADMQTGTGNFGPGTLEPGTVLLAGQEKIEYHGPVIYRNFKIEMVLFPGGYATIGNDNAVTFHYYTQDYLGNNRAVVNGSTGAIEQTTAYYPYGAVIPDLGTGNDGQPFKFGGKELVSANGLNMYDFGARLHYPAIPLFDRIDPMAEKYAWLSPYLYCGNNPVNLIDPTGMIWDDPEEVDKLKNMINDRIEQIEQKISRKNDDINNKSENWSEKKINKEQSALQELNKQVANLKKSLTTIAQIGNDVNTYAFEDGENMLSHGVRKGEDGLVYIQTSSPATSIHEITHIGQSLNNGGLVFDKNNYLQNAGKYVIDQVNMEVEAYQSQYSMNPNSMPLSISNYSKIDSFYLEKISYPNTGTMAYPYAKDYNDYLRKKK